MRTLLWHILIVDEEHSFPPRFVRRLRRYQYRVTTVHTVRTVPLVLAMNKPDMALVDATSEDVTRALNTWRTLPNQNTLRILKIQYRSTIAHGQEIDPNEAFCLFKPFSEEELLGCIQLLEQQIEQQRLAHRQLSMLRIDALSIDLTSAAVFLENQTIHVTRHEFKLLKALVLAEGNPVSYTTLLNDIYPYSHHDEHFGQYSVIRGLVRQLRHKIEDDFRKPRYILTVPRTGYRLNMSHRN